MCRHEAAEALGALGDAQSLEVLRRFRDRAGEEVVVTETCEIAIDRIEWENSEQRKQEKLRQRWVHGSVMSELCYVHAGIFLFLAFANCGTAISPLSTLLPLCRKRTAR